MEFFVFHYDSLPISFQVTFPLVALDKTSQPGPSGLQYVGNSPTYCFLIDHNIFDISHCYNYTLVY